MGGAPESRGNDGSAAGAATACSERETADRGSMRDAPHDTLQHRIAHHRIAPWVSVTPTATLAVCPNASVNVRVHDPAACAVTVNVAGAVAVAGVTVATPLHAPADALTVPAYPVSLAASCADCDAASNASVVFDTSSGPAGGVVATASRAGDAEDDPPPHASRPIGMATSAMNGTASASAGAMSESGRRRHDCIRYAYASAAACYCTDRLRGR